jgi:hypothetical protein
MEKVGAHYVVTDRDHRLRTEMEMMIENVAKKRDPDRPYGADNRLEGTAIAIVSGSGAGKTSAMLHYLKDNPFFPHYRDPLGGCQLISIGVKAPCTLRQLGMSTLRAAGYPSSREMLENQAWPQAHFQVRDQDILFLHYEEAQRIIQQKNVGERRKIVETLAGLMTDLDWPLYLILSGLPQISDLFQDDFLGDPATQSQAERDAHVTLKRRTRFVDFLPIDPKADRKILDEGLKQYEKLAGVSLKVVKEVEARGRLCHAGARQFGLFYQLTVMAIDACVRAGRKVVTIEDFADAYAGRVLEPVELNPFIGDHWESIDTRLIQHKPERDDDEGAGKPDRRRTDA